LEGPNQQTSQQPTVLGLPWQHLASLNSLSLTNFKVLVESNSHDTDTGGKSDQESQPLTSLLNAAAPAALAVAAAPAAPFTGINPSHVASLAALTALTSLYLKECTTNARNGEMVEWVASQASGLTALRMLELASNNTLDGSNGPAAAARAAAACDMLAHPGLANLRSVHLTIPHLHSDLFHAAPSSFSRLQHLILSKVGSREDPLQMRPLPSSLILLGLRYCHVSWPPDWQSTRLTALALTETHTSPAILARMPELCYLTYLANHEHQEKWGANELLAVLPQLKKLQVLELETCDFTLYPDDAAACTEAKHAEKFAALTASSELVSLSLKCCSLPAGAAHHMFASGRLLKLRMLNIAWAEELEQYNWWTSESSKRVVSLAPGAGDLALLAACCPNSEELSTV
jgi:hypothetical protein